jgi:DNA-3-methyladenine glycosylase II
MSETLFEKEIEVLKEQDELLSKVIDSVGRIKGFEWNKRDPFYNLAMNIAYQQLAGSAAKAIWNRVKERTEINPKGILITDLEGTGLSRMKINYMKDLAQKFLDGTIQPKKFPKMSDEEIIDELVKVKGIGRWTAEMFLMFSLKRMDVFSNGDLGLRKAVQKLYGLDKLPGKKELDEITGKWSPYRTIASLYLWKWVD